MTQQTDAEELPDDPLDLLAETLSLMIKLIDVLPSGSSASKEIVMAHLMLSKAFNNLSYQQGEKRNDA